jgi:acetyl esterase
MLQRCWAQYLDRPEDGTSPYASVVEAADLRGLPPAFVVTAECDVLCSEGERYAERLREADVATTHRRYAGMPHGFLGLPSLDETKRALTDIGAALRAHL